MARLFISLFLLALTIHIGLASFAEETQKEVLADHRQDKKEILLANDWLKILIDYKNQIQVKAFHFRSHNFLWPTTSEAGLTENFPYSQTVLFKEQPNLSAERFEFRSNISAKQITTKNSNSPSFRLSTQNDSLSMQKEFSVYPHQSILYVTTTIKNLSKSTITFFPTEITCQYAPEKGEKRTYSFIPQSPKYAVTIGEADRDNLKTDKNDLFYAYYENKVSEIKLTSKQNWTAMYDSELGYGCAIEHLYPSDKLEVKSNNRILYINGAGSYQKNGRLVIRPQTTDRYMRMARILGKVTLNPKESFTYTTLWSASACPGPIYQVKQGVMTNTKLKVYTAQTSYILIGAFGIPERTNIGFLFLDENGNVLKKNKSISLNMHSLGRKSRPSMAVPHYQTWLSHKIFFSPKDFKGPSSLHNKIKTIRFVSLDENKNVKNILGEAQAPFPEYESLKKKKE